jgi:CDP-diacylglycerol pyrophosphatase
MGKRLLMSLVALVVVAGLALAGQVSKGKSGAWTGVITDDNCGAKMSKGDAACTKKCVSQKGAKLALYDEASKDVYVLDPQEKITGHEGHHVTVKGTLDPDTKTIHVSSLSMSPASGL